MAPDQEQATNRWRAGAQDALDTAQKLYESKKFHHALFFCHLAVEKALKAKYIAVHNEMPPYTHDVLLLASRSGTNFSQEQLRALAELNTFNVSARYEEDKLELYNKATPEYARHWIDQTSLIIQSIL
jgi:HEPN domain-containing protein